MTDPQALPSKSMLTAVRFRYGSPKNPTFLRLTDWTSDVNLGPDLYLSCPTMEVGDIKSTIGLDEPPVDIALRTDIGPGAALAARLSNGEPHSRVHVRIHEFTIDGGDVDERLAFVGTVGVVKRNPSGRKNLASIQVNSWKSLLDRPAGIPLTLRCPWTLGGWGCFLKPPIEKKIEVGTVAAISGKFITITGLDDHSVGSFASAIYWKWGHVEIDGCVLDVVDWSEGSPTLFRLNRRPPSDWLGQSVNVTPGCIKTPDRCDEWDNREHFGSIARKMDNRNPFMETSEEPED